MTIEPLPPGIPTSSIAGDGAGMSLIESSLLDLVRNQGCTITRLEREIVKKDAIIAALRAGSSSTQADPLSG